MKLLEIQHVFKRYNDLIASNDITFDIDAGTIFGLLGPNGAGKTTLIRMITNIITPDSGQILLLGQSVSALQKNNIGYLPEERGLYKKLKVLEQLTYFGQLKGMTRFDAIRSTRQWLSRLGADGWESKKVSELSKGMAQKIQFIAAVMHSPEILILDEPFSGLDPISSDLFINTIQELKNEGKSIVLSTHQMWQVEKLCDDISLINKGRCIVNGSLRDVKKQYGRDTIVLEFEGDLKVDETFAGFDFNILSKTLNRMEVRVPGLIDPNVIVRRIIEAGVMLIRFELIEPLLDEIFKDKVKRDITDDVKGEN